MRPDSSSCTATNLTIGHVFIVDLDHEVVGIKDVTEELDHDIMLQVFELLDPCVSVSRVNTSGETTRIFQLNLIDVCIRSYLGPCCLSSLRMLTQGLT